MPCIIQYFKRRWIVYTPAISYNRRKIDRFFLGVVGGLIAAVFLIIVFTLFFDKFVWTGFLSISLAFFGIIIADAIGIILRRSYKL